MSLSFKSFLIEKRRFPEVNQKVDIVQYISSLESAEGIYITFINEPKLGINPINSYDTPTGIYSYPLVKFYKEVDDVVNGKDSNDKKIESLTKIKKMIVILLAGLISCYFVVVFHQLKNLLTNTVRDITEIKRISYFQEPMIK